MFHSKQYAISFNSSSRKKCLLSYEEHHCSYTFSLEINFEKNKYYLYFINTYTSKCATNNSIISIQQNTLWFNLKLNFFHKTY